MGDDEAPGKGKLIGIAYALILIVYWKYIRWAGLAPESLDMHLMIFWTLLVLGVLGWLAVAGARVSGRR